MLTLGVDSAIVRMALYLASDCSQDVMMSMVVFLPWLKLADRLQIGGFTAVPYERRFPSQDLDGDQVTVMQAVTDPYRVGGDVPTRHATFIQVGDGALTRDLSEEEINKAFQLVELLAVSGLSRRAYFDVGLPGEGYWNRDNFHVVVQSFSGSPAGATITTRRRDGYGTHLMDSKHYRVQKPEHVNPDATVAIDMPLLEHS